MSQDTTKGTSSMSQDTTIVAVTQLRAFIERIEPVNVTIMKLSTCEVWKSIAKYPNYEISSFGRVKRNGKLLKLATTHGYKTVSLSSQGQSKSYRVHRLVVAEFIGDAPFANAIVAHNDGNRSNNIVCNLRWASALENQADSIRHGTRPKGSRVYGSKLKETDIPKIRTRLAVGESYPQIARDFNVSISTIHLIKHEKIWAHV